MFKDREDAGNKLARALEFLRGQDAIILAIPRGGVVVAAAVAKELNLPLSIIIPRKIGAPDNPELAIGAVAGDGSAFLKEDLITALGVSQEYLRQEIDRQVVEIRRREASYLGGEGRRIEITGKKAIIVDDGIATGSTAIAAVRAAKEQNPREVILAVPVAPGDGKRALEAEADQVVVLDIPEVFFAVGQFYQVFEQTTDEEVVNLLRRFSD